MSHRFAPRVIGILGHDLHTEPSPDIHGGSEARLKRLSALLVLGSGACDQETVDASVDRPGPGRLGFTCRLGMNL